MALFDFLLKIDFKALLLRNTDRLLFQIKGNQQPLDDFTQSSEEK
jgi:hypothetical protein